MTIGNFLSSLDTPARDASASTRTNVARQVKLKGNAIMKMTKLVILIVMIALALFLILPSLSWAADDGAAIFKAKCAMCHGADLAGKPAAKIPSLVGDDAKKASDADLTDMIANGGKDKKASHAFANKGVTPDQVKMVVSYIREAQKK
jgi:mono/diheme cytochrome c family protein